MRFKLYREHGSLNSAPVFGAAEQGLKQLGHDVVNAGEDVPVIWSVLWHGRMQGNKQIFDSFRKHNKPVLVIEVGGISRGETWKVAVNGINREATWPKFDYDNLERAKKLGLELHPWRTRGDHILLCGQHERSHQWRNMPPVERWVENTITEIRKHTDRKIIFRPHPRCRVPDIEHKFSNVVRQTPQKIPHTYDEFNMAFDNAWATVSWSSNPGIRSALNGIPVFTGPESLAYDVSMKDLSLIENPPLPDREQWLARYSHTEFTLQEIASGMPFEKLLNALDL